MRGSKSHPSVDEYNLRLTMIMKKIFTLSIAVAISVAASAETLQIFSCSGGIPGQSPNEPQLMGFSISADGNYICGAVEQAAGFFVANCTTGEVKWKIDGEAGSELRGVDNNGVAIGFIDNDGVLFNFETGESSLIKAPSGVRYVQGEALSNDGTVMVGSFTDQSFSTQAAYSAGGEAWEILPMPSDAELGALKENISEVSAAKLVSGDGSLIVGYLGSFTFPIIWTKDANGKYVADFYPAKFVKVVEEDRNDTSKELYAISGMFTCMSNNGKYVGTVGLIADDTDSALRTVPVIYNTEDKTLKIYKEIQEIDEYGLGLYPRAIADDGTFIGVVSSPADPAGNFGAFIMKAGKEQAESYLDAFPTYAEELGESELYGLNIPTGISADGSRILGYTYYSDDFDIQSDAPAYYLTYVINVEGAGVEEIGTAVQPGAEEVYSIDGRKLRRMAKGLNIVRNADGSVSKILKK